MTLTLPDFVMPRESDGRNMLHLGPWKFSVGTWDAPVAPRPSQGFSYSGFVSRSLDSMGLGFNTDLVTGKLLGGGLGSWVSSSGLGFDSQTGAAIVLDVMLGSKRKV